MPNESGCVTVKHQVEQLQGHKVLAASCCGLQHCQTADSQRSRAGRSNARHIVRFRTTNSVLSAMDSARGGNDRRWQAAAEPCAVRSQRARPAQHAGGRGGPSRPTSFPRATRAVRSGHRTPPRVPPAATQRSFVLSSALAAAALERLLAAHQTLSVGGGRNLSLVIRASHGRPALPRCPDCTGWCSAASRRRARVFMPGDWTTVRGLRLRPVC